MIAGTLEIQMLANMARLADDMNKAKSVVGGAMGNIEKSVQQAKSALAALGIGLSAGYFVSLIKASIDAADHLNDLSKSTGIVTGDLAGLRLLAKQTGTDLDGLAAGILKMSVAMGKDPEKFKALGVTAKDNTGAFRQLADIFNLLPDINQRNALSQAVFGKSWKDMAPALSEGSQKIGEIIEKGRRLSGITAEMTAASDEFNDKWAELAGTGGLLTRQVASLLPILNTLADYMLEAQNKSTGLTDEFHPLAEAFRAVVVLGGNVGFVLRGIGRDIGGLAAQMAALAHGDIAGHNAIGAMMKKDGEEARAAFDIWEKKMMSVGTVAVATGNTVVAATEGMTDAQKKAAAAASQFLKDNQAASAAAYDSFMKSVREKIALEQAEAAAGQKLADAQKFRVELESKLAEILKTATPLQAEAAKVLVAEAILLKEANAERAHRLKMIEDEYKAFVAYLDKIDSETKSVTDSTKSLQENTAEMGLSGDALLAVKNARNEATIATLSATLAGIDETHQTSMQAEAIRAQIDSINGLKKAQSENNEATKALDVMKQQADMWKTIDQTAQQTFVSIFNSGKSAFDRLRDTLKNGLYALLYEITVKKWLISIAASVSGTGVATQAFGAANAAQGGGGSGGIGSWLSSGKSVYDVISSGNASMIASASSLGEQAGYWASQAVGASQTTAEAMVTAGGQIGAAASYVGAGLAGIAIGSAIAGDKKVIGIDGTSAAAIGAAIGGVVFGPIGALAGGVLGGAFNAAFGMGSKQAGATALAGNFSQSGFSGAYQTPWHQDGGWFRSDKSGTDYQALAQDQSAGFSKIVAGTSGVFNRLISVSGDAEHSLYGWAFAINRQVATQEQQKQLVIDLANSMGSYLLPGLVNFQKEGENLADTAVRLSDIFIATDGIAKMLGQTFENVGFSSAIERNNLIEMMGGLQSASASMQTYYDDFYSASEKHDRALKAVNEVMTLLGVTTLPHTREEFRKLINAQDVNSLSGQRMITGLLGLAPAFASVTDAMIDSTQAAKDAAAQIAQMTLLSTDNFKTEMDYRRYLNSAKLAGVSAANDNTFGIPSFAVGTNELPTDMLLKAHQGERIIPAADNRELMSRLRGSEQNGAAVAEMRNVASEIKQLRTEVQAANIAVATNTNTTAKILSRWEGDGMPAVRTV